MAFKVKKGNCRGLFPEVVCGLFPAGLGHATLRFEFDFDINGKQRPRAATFLQRGMHAGSCTLYLTKYTVRYTQIRILRYDGGHDALSSFLLLRFSWIRRHYLGRAFPQRRTEGASHSEQQDTSCTPILGTLGWWRFSRWGRARVGIKPEKPERQKQQGPDGGRKT